MQKKGLKISSRSREPSLVSRLVSWDKCLVTPVLYRYLNIPMKCSLHNAPVCDYLNVAEFC